MPTMTNSPQYTSEPSDLVEGIHPAFLVAITEEDTPSNWESAKKSPRIWRWHFAVAASHATVANQIPELQTAVSSTIFSGGKTPSKSYTWTCTLIGRDVPTGESIDLDPMLPLPCQLFIHRHDKNRQPIQYANIDKTILSWSEGAQMLTPEFRQKLALWWSMKQSQAQAEPQAPAPPPTPVPAAQPWISPGQTPDRRPGQAPEPTPPANPAPHRQVW